MIIIYHHTKFELPGAFDKIYKILTVQTCIMSTFMSLNIVQLFHLTNMQDAKILISVK